MTRVAAGLVVSCALGVLLTFVSANQQAAFGHRQESVQQQLALYRGEALQFDGRPMAYAQARSRILFPALLSFVSRLAPSWRPSQWYLALRIAFGIGMAALVYLVLWRATGTPEAALVGVAALAYCLLFTFSHPWEHAWDYGDALFTVVFAWLTTRPDAMRWTNRVAFGLVVLLAATNRESAAFAGVLWFCCHAVTWQPRLDA